MWECMLLEYMGMIFPIHYQGPVRRYGLIEGYMERMEKDSLFLEILL